MMEGQEESNNNDTISSLGSNSLLACMTLLCWVCYQLSPPGGAAAVRASKACASAVGILSLLLLSKAVVAVCELVADRLLKEVMSTLMALFSLLMRLLLVSVLIVSSSTSVSSSRALQVIATMEIVKSTVWLLRSCGCHEKVITVLQECMNSPVFCNAVGKEGGNDTIGGHAGSTSSTGGAEGWLQIKFDSCIATHLGKLWSSNDDRYRHIVLLSITM